MAATPFTYDPANDYVGAVDDSTADITKPFSDNLALRGNAIVGNDLVVASLIAMGLLPNCSKTTATPVSPLDRDLWYDPTNHVLRRYDLAAGTWDLVNPARMAEIIGGRGAGIISTSRTYRVPTDFATPWAAEQYLLDFAISKRAAITVEIAPGTYNHVAAMKGHPDGDRIVYKPTTGSEYAGGAPVAADFVMTGNTAAIVVTDRTANVAIVKTKHRVVINSPTDGVAINPGHFFKAQDLCFVGAGAGTGLASSYSSMASVGGCSFVSFTRGWWAFYGGAIFSTAAVGKACLVGNTIAGALAANGGQVFDLNGGFCANNGDATGSAGGLIAHSNSTLTALGWQISGTNGQGVVAVSAACINVQGGTVKYNAGNGLRTNSLGNIMFANGVATNNLQYGAYMSGGGNIYLESATLNSNGSGGALLSQGGTAIMTTAIVNSNGGPGINVSDGTYVTLYATTINSNTGDALSVSSGIVTGYATISTNGGRGIYANHLASVNLSNAATSITGNIGNGVFSTNGSNVSLQSATVTGNGTADYNATNGGFINAQGYTGAPVFSPAINTVGNFNSYIRG